MEECIMSKNYKFKRWDEVLDCEIDYFIEDLDYLDIPENYEEIIEIIDNSTDDYTEWGEDEEFSVAEDFKYTDEEWREKIDNRCRPIMEKWLSSYCEECKKISKIEKKDCNCDYIDKFWERNKDN